MDRIALSVIIPVYNEEKIVADTAKTLVEYLDGKFPGGNNVVDASKTYEIIFSDDGSTDATAECVKSFNHPCVRLVGHMPNKGKGAAVRDGMLSARGEVALFTDCDLAYGTEVIGAFYDALTASNSDAAIGSRRLHKDGYAGYTLLRKLASKVYYKVVALLAGFKYSDSQCGIKCFKTELAKRVFSQCKIDGFAFDLEAMLLVSRSGANVLELPVKIINHRESKVRIVRDTFRMLRDVLRIRRLHHT